MGHKMSKPPIFYTIGQIKFNPILNMAKFVTDLQESLRSRFPDYRQETIANIQLRATSDDEPQQVTHINRWHFIDLHKTSGFILQREALAFHTTAYETSEDFLKNVLDGISLVNKFASLTFIESVAIRTLDAVVPAPGLNVRDYLNPAVRGLSEGLNGQLKHSVTETLWEIVPDGVLISRVAIVKGSLATPMDLVGLNLELRADLKNINLEHALLDNDRQDKRRFAFDPEEILKRLVTVKKDVTEAFQKTVTPVALEQWK